MSTDGGPGEATRRPTGAPARLRLLRRAAAALLPLEHATVQANVETGPISPEREYGDLRTDLIVAASDLRIRVSGLPGRDEAVLDRLETMQAAMSLLLEYPETAAVVVLADNGPLTARLFEPADSPRAILSTGARAGGNSDAMRRGPLGEVIRTYLQQVNPGWEDVPLLASSQVDLRAEAQALAEAQLANLRSGRKNTPEWRAARQSLGEADISWVTELALELRFKGGSDVLARVQAQARRGRSS